MSFVATLVLKGNRRVDYSVYSHHKDDVRKMMHEELAHMLYDEMQSQFGGYTTDALRIAYQMGQRDGCCGVTDFEKVLRQVDGRRGQA